MATIAVRNEIHKGIGSPIIAAEGSDGLDMMHVKLPSKLLFCDTALLAGVTVTSAGVTALSRPVRAIVRKVAAFPVMVILAAIGLAEIEAEATLRAKVQFGLLNLKSIAVKCLAALITYYVNARTAIVKIVATIDRRSTDMRTELARAGAVIPEMLAAPGAVCPEMRRRYLTLAATPTTILGVTKGRGIVRHRLSALFARRLHSRHGIMSWGVSICANCNTTRGVMQWESEHSLA